MTAKPAPSEEESDETGGHPASTMGGVAPVSTVTDTWSTPHPKADATKLSSLPKTVANAIDGKDHSEDPVYPDQGGEVVDTIAADANAAESN